MSAMAVMNDVVVLPDAPAIPGLVFRRFRGESDYSKMVAVLDVSREFDRIDYVTTLEDLINSYTHLVHCDPYQDMLLAEVDGQVIGYSRTEWFKNEGEQFYEHYHLHFLMPAWRGQGIEPTLFHAMERQGRERVTAHSNDLPSYFSTEVLETQTVLEAVIQSEGYHAIRHYYNMVRPTLDDIPEAPLPTGVEVRPARPEHYRAIWEEMQEAFQDHWGYVPGTEENYQEWLNGRLFQPALWQIAWAGDEVIGTVLAFIDEAQNRKYNRRRGYTEEITVRRPWRKHGVARALIARSLQQLKALGMTEAALGVDTENLSGALRLYESMGFRPVQRGSIYAKPL